MNYQLRQGENHKEFVISVLQVVAACDTLRIGVEVGFTSTLRETIHFRPKKQ
jgi:hypothetical protein